MPAMNIAEPKDLLTSIQAMATLIAYCVYPDNEGKRDNFIKYINVLLFRYLNSKDFKLVLEKGKNEDIVDKNNSEEVKDFSMYFPNFAITPDSNLNEIKERFIEYLEKPNLDIPEDVVGFLSKLVIQANFKQDILASLRPLATVVYLAFGLMRQQGVSLLKGEISLENAVKFVMTKVDTPQTFSNRKDILIAWKKYKSVVPIMMGLLFAYVSLNKVEIPGVKKSPLLKVSPLGFVMTMVFAKLTQDWLLSIKPSKHNSLRPILSKDDLWTLPEWIEKIGHHPLSLLRPFSDDEMKSIKKNQKKPRYMRKQSEKTSME